MVAKLDLGAMTQEQIEMVVREAKDNFFPHDVRIIVEAFDKLRRLDKFIEDYTLRDMSYVEDKLRRLFPTLPRSMIPFDGRPEDFLPTVHTQAKPNFNGVETKEVDDK